MHLATIDWGDGTITSGIVTNSNGTGIVRGRHRYADAGIYVITVVVDDQQGGTATAASAAMITGVTVRNGALMIVGTHDDDRVTVNEAGRNRLRIHADFLPRRGFVDVRLNDVNRVEVWLGGGDDRLHVAGSLNLPVTLVGGSGFDRFDGRVNDLLFADLTEQEQRRLDRSDCDDDDRGRGSRRSSGGSNDREGRSDDDGSQQQLPWLSMLDDVELLDEVFG